MKDPQVRQALDEVKAMLSDLTARVTALEARLTPAITTASPAAIAEGARPVALTEDVVVAITAAVAAFLGERAHVRHIRLISSSAWAQQGRVSVQASHRLER